MLWVLIIVKLSDQGMHLQRSLEWLKAQLVAKGYNQIEGVNFDETFSFVVRPPTIRIVLAVALSCRREICQLDVKNAFLRIS